MIKEEIRHLALNHGFLACGFACADYAETHDQFTAALKRGGFEGMPWLERGAEARKHPRYVLENVKTVIVFADSCRKETSDISPYIASYAQALDYHEVVRKRLKPVIDFLNKNFPGSKSRIISDSAPLLEHEWAAKAGVGWTGKNTLTVNRDFGSHFILAEILTTVSFAEDKAYEDFCGTCSACLDACPTQAFNEAYSLNASKCISYLTIEHKDSFTEEQKKLIGSHVFGCDICQDVCPWNKKPVHKTPADYGFFSAKSFADLICKDEKEFKQKFSGTPLERTGFAGLSRNIEAVTSSAPS